MTSLETVQQYYDCFNQQDWDGMLALLDPDIQHDINQGDTHTGLDHYRQFLRHMDECYEERLTNMVFMLDSTGDRIACEFLVNGVYKKTDGDMPPATGQRYVLNAGAFLEVSNGKIRRVTTYYNLPQWIRMVAP